MANEMRDRHLVTDNPQGMTEAMLNFAYVKNERVHLSYANGIEDIDLCEYIAQLTETNGCMLSADDVMNGSCIEGCNCENAVIYALAVQAAELRERLKHYESLEEQGLLLTLPCKMGDMVYEVIAYKNKANNNRIDGHIRPCVVKSIHLSDAHSKKDEPYITLGAGGSYLHGSYIKRVPIDEFGKSIFPNEEQAEQKLKEMRGGNDS